jgi:hypothetical protein
MSTRSNDPAAQGTIGQDFNDQYDAQFENLLKEFAPSNPASPFNSFHGKLISEQGKQQLKNTLHARAVQRAARLRTYLESTKGVEAGEKKCRDIVNSHVERVLAWIDRLVKEHNHRLEPAAALLSQSERPGDTGREPGQAEQAEKADATGEQGVPPAQSETPAVATGEQPADSTQERNEPTAPPTHFSLDETYIDSCSGQVQRKLLKALNGKGRVPIRDVLNAVYGASTNDRLPALLKAKDRVNRKLTNENKGCEVRQQGETLILATV